MNKRYKLTAFLVIFNLFSIYTFADDPGFPLEGDPGNEPPQTEIGNFIPYMFVIGLLLIFYFSKFKRQGNQ
jgi:hypothetical protein